VVRKSFLECNENRNYEIIVSKGEKEGRHELLGHSGVNVRILKCEVFGLIHHHLFPQGGR